MKWRIALVSTVGNTAYGPGKMTFLKTFDGNTREFKPIDCETEEAAEVALRSWIGPGTNWMGYVIPHEGDPTGEGVSPTKQE